MTLPFKNPLFQAQWLRTAGHASAGGADLGECYAIADRIRDGDPESWRDGWNAFADRIAQEAARSAERGRMASAHDAFLRASNYYRAAYLFDLRPGAADRLRAGYRAQRESFRNALSTGQILAKPIEIPFEGKSLPGYFFRAAGSSPRPTMIITGGYDSTAEELYFYSAPAALARGYNVLCYDGPGQGGALIEQGLVFRPDWESVLTPVFQAAASKPEVDRKKIAALGLSFGGYLAPRGATGVSDLAALIADPGQFSLLEEMRSRLPGPLGRALPDGNKLVVALVEKMVDFKLRDPTGGWAIRRGLFTHGVERPIDYLKLTAQYTLERRVDRISCPTFIASAEADQIGVTAGKLYELLHCPKTFKRFLAADGAGAHCEAGARKLFNQCTFDWLDEQFKHESASPEFPKLRVASQT